MSKSSPIVRNEFNHRPVLHFTAIHPPLPTRLPAPDPSDKKFNSRLVAPTVFRNEPLGENVEGLSYYGDQSYNSKLVFNSHTAMV
jgi:hypothetical protein